MPERDVANEPFVHHVDGHPGNNHPSNLRIVYPSENISRAEYLGRREAAEQGRLL
jgi:hypothetical protein